MYHHGWFNVAFERDLREDLTPAVIGGRRLMLARMPDGVRAFSADCPHRGAHLAYGGRLADDAVICPFHGYKVCLGERGGEGFSVAAYPTLNVGGIIFVRLSASHDCGFEPYIQRLMSDHTLVPGFEMPVRVSSELVIENAFDQRHFHTVHHIGTRQFKVDTEPAGNLLLRSSFNFPATGWLKDKSGSAFLEVPFTARTFSPGIIISQLGGDTPYTVMTTSTPQPDGSCMIRLSLALPHAHYGPTPNTQFASYLLAQSRKGLTDDQLMWENLSPTAPQRLTVHDHPCVAFQEFCRTFAVAG